MKLTEDEMRAVEARHQAERDQFMAQMRDNPPFSRGGYAYAGDPTLRREMHVIPDDADNPRCTTCGSTIFGDEFWLPNLCPLTEDERHVYPNGEKAWRSPLQRAVADLIEDPED